jgi:hypothetical protein
MSKTVKLISHRGNINGSDSLNENAPLYIDAAISAKFDVEVDFWKIDHRFYLGHDHPQYEVNYRWFKDREHKLWIHCKNQAALEMCQNAAWKHFWHETDQYTLVSNGVVWAYPTSAIVNDSIIAVPESFHGKQGTYHLLAHSGILGICSDYVGYYKSIGKADFTVI